MKRAGNILVDTKTMTGRCLLLSKRNPDTFLTSIITPILMMALFAFVFGGAIQVGEISYVNFIIPGIILQCIGQGASTTAINVSYDINKGIIDRFRIMPISKPSILMGHVLGALIRNIVTTFIVIIVAFIVGFRPTAQVHEWLAVLCILLLYILTISLISVFFGIIANSPEGAGAFSVFALVLPYLSSGFVPVETMPKVLRIFSENQPMTPIIDSIRVLLTGGDLEMHTIILAIAWCLVLTAIFYLLAIKVFNNKVAR